MSAISQNEENAPAQGVAKAEAPTNLPEPESDRLSAGKKHPRILSRFLERLLSTLTLIASLLLALTTFYLARTTAAQVEASRESIELQHQVLTKFKLALDQFSEELEIAQANRASLDKLAKSAHQAVQNSTTALGGSPEIVSVDGCRAEKTDDKQMYVLPDLTDCDYVKVVIRNPGRIKIKAHALLNFIVLNIPCPSNTLEIAPLGKKQFAVHVDACLAGHPPDSPKKVTFLVTVDTESDKTKS